MATDLALIARRTDNVLSFIPDEYKGYKFRFKVAGSTGREYTVSLRISDNVWCCDCPGWCTTRNCKHLRPMLPVLTAAVAGSKAADPIARRIKGRS